MLTKERLQKNLYTHPLVKPRLDTLKLAEEIYPKFKNPHIVGGFLRNLILGTNPNDCDVVFQGYKLDQPGILEAIREAESKLQIDHYNAWECENISATGYSGNLYDDVIGKYSFHTDFLTMLLMDVHGDLYIGEQEKTLSDFENKIYDLRFAGVEMWAKHRGNGRTYASCITGDLTRGLYLCQSLNLNPSPITDFLMHNYDTFFKSLAHEDRVARKNYWIKKTKGNSVYKIILRKYGIKSL